MFEMLAQTVNTYTQSSSSWWPTDLNGLFALIGVILLVTLVIYVVSVVAFWKIFEKANVEGWKAIIPIYNSWVYAEIAGKPGWWGIVGIGASIPKIGMLFAIASLVLWILIELEIAKKFGKSTTFAVVGLIIFSLVGILILAFDDSKYDGSSVKSLDQGGGGNGNSGVKPLV